MLKDIILKTAELINRDDITEQLKSQTQTNSNSTQNDILRLISYYNYTIEKLCENYFTIQNTQNIYSDKNRKISYLNFEFEPIKILSVLKNGKPVLFSEYSKYITVPEANVCYEIVYKYLPDSAKNLEDKITLPKGVTIKTVCYGMASEFLASKNQIDQAEYWNNKFMLEIFKSKTSRNRKIKQTFFIWEIKH